MTFRRPVIAALCALSVAAAAPAAVSAATPSRAAFELSASGKRALGSLTITAVPRGPGKQPTFAVRDWTVGTSAKIRLSGSLRFAAGRRAVSVSRLELTIGRTSSYVTGSIGKSAVRVFAVTPTRPSVLDAEKRQASMVGAKFALTPAAAKRLRSALRLSRTPSTAALGKLTVAVAPPPATAPAPISPPSPAATATPAATPPSEPELPCAQRFAATPAGSIDWFGCDLSGNGDLKSWTNYIQRAFPQSPCQGPLGAVTPADGAARVVAAEAYDHRFPILSGDVPGDGSATIVVGGNVTYAMPVHGIEESIGAFRIVIAPGGLTGTVYADGRAKPIDTSGSACTTPATPYTAEPVLTLDLAGITPVTAGGVKRWVHVPARIASGTQKIGGGNYPAGSAWGSFTIAVPAP